MKKATSLPAFELTLIVTHNCNLNCVYCYEHNKHTRKVMSIDVAKDAIQDYLSNGKYEEVKIGFIGGEPLLEFQLIKNICEWTWQNQWKKKFIFYATTNGTIMTKEMKDWFYKHRNQFWLSLSLDGSKETHNKNRCNSFDKIDLDFFLHTWPEQPVKMTISELNLSNLANDVIYIHELGFKLNGVNFAEGIEISNFQIKQEIIIEQFSKLVDYYLLHPEIENPRIFNLPLSHCETRTYERRKRCGTGGNMSVIDYDGKKYPCTYFSPISMQHDDLEAILNLDFNDDNVFIDDTCFNNCYIYPICFGCYGDNYSTTGQIKTRSKQKCILNKLRAMATAKYISSLLLKKMQNATKVSQVDIDTINAIKKINDLIRI